MSTWLKRKASSPAKADGSGSISCLRIRAIRCWPSSARSLKGRSVLTAPDLKSRPSTAACSSTVRSPASRLAIRAARTAWTLGGSSPSPRSAWVATSCSRQNGLPSAVWTILPASTCRRPPEARESTSSRAAGWESSSRTTSERFRWGAAQDERDSRSSGRARQRTKIGAAAQKEKRYSSRSTSSGSAQWTSSTTTTRGWSRATASSRRRTAQKVSSGGPRGAVGSAVPLLSPPDERRSRPDWFVPRPQPQQPPGLDLRASSLQFGRLQRLGPHVPLDEPVGPLAEEDLVCVGHLLQAGG